MLKKELIQNDNLYKTIQNDFLITLPSHQYSGITIDLARLENQSADGFFFEAFQQNPTLIDFYIGNIKGKEDPILLATVLKSTLLRFAKPIFNGYHFHKEGLWQKNYLDPSEILKKTYEEIGELIHKFDQEVDLFYGRIHLDYNYIDYVNCGFPNPFHYISKEQNGWFFEDQISSFDANTKDEFLSYQVPIHPNDVIVFNSNHLINSKKNGTGVPINFLTELFNKETDLNASELMQEVKDKILLSSHLKENPFLIFLKINSSKDNPIIKSDIAKFTSDLTQLTAVRNFIKQVCQQVPGNCERLCLQLQLLGNEAFCNIIKHSYHDNPKEEIIIESQVTSEGIFLTISDRGDSFNPTEIKFPSLTGDQENGFGFFIIQKIADFITYIPKILDPDQQWNHLRIFKRFLFEGEQMEFTHQIKNNILVITPINENLDAKNAAAFKQGVLDLIQLTGLYKLIFDLHHFQFIDSSGLGAFLSLQRTLNVQGGSLKLACLNQPIRTMFEIVSMHRIFDIFNSVDDAVIAFH